MGDRITWFEDCPKCKAKGSVEYYDHSSAITYVGLCEKCGWSDPHDYYELYDDMTALMTPKEYQAWSKRTGLKAINLMPDKEFATRKKRYWDGKPIRTQHTKESE